MKKKGIYFADHGIRLAQRRHAYKGHTFTVQYGEQLFEGLTYAEAAKELGECLMHSLACQGVIDA